MSETRTDSSPGEKNGSQTGSSQRVRHVGLSVGTSRLVVSREGADGFQYAQQRTSYLVLPHSNMTLRTLEALQIPTLSRGGKLVVYGNEAENLADLFRVEARRPLKQGILNPEEPESEDHLLRLLASVVGLGSNEETRLCFTVPSLPLTEAEGVRYQISALLRLAQKLGMKGCSVEKALAVVFAEMKDSNYTGLAITFGAGLVNVCLAYLSVPVISFSIPDGGDRVDENTARITGEHVLRVRQFKEQKFSLAHGRPVGDAASERRQRVLTVYYEEMIRKVLASLTERFQKQDAPRLERPIPVVLAGGGAMPEGFAQRFEQILHETKLPFPATRVRVAENPAQCAARGALIAALSEM